MAEPKYRRILVKLIQQVENLAPGDRLSTVRQLMEEHRVSQAAIERCLDEMVRQGLVRRERSRGIFVEGFVPQSRFFGVCTNDAAGRDAAALFLVGVRQAAEREGFHVADFGPVSIVESRSSIVGTMKDMGFAGLILDVSTRAAMHVEGDRELVEFLRALHIPLVVTRALPTIPADTVTADDFQAFRRLGQHLRQRVAGRVRFVGHLGLPTLSRLFGLQAGLGEGVEVEVDIRDSRTGGAHVRIKELKACAHAGSLVVGAPLADADAFEVFTGGPWAAGTGRELALMLEPEQHMPPGLVAHVVTKPTVRMGEEAARLLLRRITHPRIEPSHVIIPHDVHLVGK